MYRFFVLFATFLLMPVSAFAYIDPGSGMLFWQGVVAAVAVLLALVRDPLKFVKRIIDRLRRR